MSGVGFFDAFGSPLAIQVNPVLLGLQGSCKKGVHWFAYDQRSVIFREKRGLVIDSLDLGFVPGCSGGVELISCSVIFVALMPEFDDPLKDTFDDLLEKFVCLEFGGRLGICQVSGLEVRPTAGEHALPKVVPANPLLFRA